MVRSKASGLVRMLVMNKWRVVLPVPLRLVAVISSSTIQALPGQLSLSSPPHARGWPEPECSNKGLAAAGGLQMLLALGLFVAMPLDPAAVALGGAVATLFISHHSGLQPVDDLLASIDWATLLYFAAVFVLVGGLERSGALDALSGQLAQRVGRPCWPAVSGCCC
ncbi:MAG: SLC13 family permease [Cyanobium sp.]|jgi:Na+/H+ antiporter NhaD/arsenite permease-like protein